MTEFAYTYQETAPIPNPPDQIFAFIDDHLRFSSHMGQSSLMMAGSKMKTTLDEKKGGAVGSHIYMEGDMLGFHLSLDEIVTERKPPHLKVWQTVGTPQLMVIGHYQMRAQILPHDSGSQLTVTINYNLPQKHAWLGKLLGGWYAKWCVQQMLYGTQKYFINNEGGEQHET